MTNTDFPMPVKARKGNGPKTKKHKRLRMIGMAQNQGTSLKHLAPYKPVKKES